jgi:sRNA-binding carbon storage regulator CsrA
MTWKNYLNLYESVEAAREAFESDCTTLFKRMYPEYSTRRVATHVGDGGVDIFIGNIGIEPITVIQCKFFIDDFGDSQKGQIRESFTKAVTSEDYSIKEWILAIPRTLTLEQNNWWEKWRKDREEDYGLETDAIKLYDGETLIDYLRDNGLFDRVFKLEEKVMIREIHDAVNAPLIPTLSLEDISKELTNASFYLEGIPNYFGNDDTTHIPRDETASIYDWVTRDLTLQEKGVYVLEGEKGYGKSVILKDLFVKLREENYDVIGIKADKHYALHRSELEKKIFQKDTVSFEAIAKILRKNHRRFIFIIDQLDALSQTLSANREYIQTYNHLIAALSQEPNARIILSARTFDLNYDAELRMYRNKSYGNLKVKELSRKNITQVLEQFGITTSSDRLMQLLCIPNHLDIFCRLPHKNLLNHDTLSTLKDLYDSLWRQTITEQENPRLSGILYIIASKMYDQQGIVVKNIFEDYKREIHFLVSNRLLVENNNELQFFHQTFYDYTYSKQFVEGKLSLEGYINENGQSLYCRAVIKMVIDYYRDFDHSIYITTLKNIIEGDGYRFHIKSLLVANLATVGTPLPSECFLGGDLLDNPLLGRVFINSVNSKGWVAFLLNRDFPSKYLAMDLEIPDLTTPSTKIVMEDKVFWILRLFLSNMDHSAREITKYLQKSFSFTGKQNFIQRLLTMSEHWYLPEMVELFEEHVSYDEEGKRTDNFYYFHSLEKMYPFHPEFVHKKVKSVLLLVFERHEEIAHDLKSLIENMLDTLPEEACDFLADIIVILAEKMRYDSSFENAKTVLHRSMLFSNTSIAARSSEPGELLLSLLLKSLIKRIDDEAFIKLFFNQHKDSVSMSVLKLLALVLQEKPKGYTSEIVELLGIVAEKNGFNGLDDMFQYAYRTLIAKSLPHLSLRQSHGVVKILHSISHPYEKEVCLDRDGNKYHRLGLYGNKKYLFLDAIPRKVLLQYPTLEKAHQELFRKFGLVTDLQLDVSRTRYGSSTAPLRPSAYLYMSDEHWIRSMEKFNDEHIEGFYTGGKLEHKRAFTEAIKKNPLRFYDLICRLFTLTGISHDYYGAGIEGLIEAKFPVKEILPLYHKFINLPLNTSNTLSAVHNADYFISEEAADTNIVEFLSRMALGHPNPERINNPDHPLHDTLNSVRGAAVYGLVRCNYNMAFSEIIFSTLEKAASDPVNTVRIGIIANLAYLNILNLDRAFRLFLTLTDTDELPVLGNAFWSANFYRLNYYNDLLKPLIEQVIANEMLHENGGTFIVLSWLMGYDKEGEYYYRFIKASKAARLQAIHVAEENLISNGKVDQKCIEILSSFLDEQDEDFVHPYSTLVLRKFEPEYFAALYPLMQRYAKTELLRQDPSYFVEYLLKSVKKHPMECLKLLKFIDFSEKPNMQKRGYYKGEPVQLILSIYNALNASMPEKRQEISDALDIFDNMLTSEHLRSASFEALDTIQK